MTGCMVLENVKPPARKNGKRLPCERLQAENFKLRGLVVWLLEYCNDLDSCEGCEVVAECETEDNTDLYGFPIACVAYERIVAEAEALGIEVRHG